MSSSSLDMTLFCYNFIDEFFKSNTSIFNMNVLVRDAKEKIRERKDKYKERYKEWFINEKENSYAFVNEECKNENEEIYDDLIMDLEGDFVYELFDVLNTPIKWAFERCKGECPNGDMFDGTGDTDINLKYNRKILKWAFDEVWKVE